MTGEKGEQRTILISAGGTGGHVFPARALTEELLAKNYKVVIATDTRGLRYLDGLDSVEKVIVASGAYRAGLAGKVGTLFSLMKGYVQSHQLISRVRPVAVAGFGGYPSFPTVLAAQHRGVPTILHEQNAVLGMANKCLAPGARHIALSAAHTRGIKPEWAGKCMTTGNPVRKEIIALANRPYPDPVSGKLCVMVVGGSQGAKSFAGPVPQAIASLPEEIRKNLFVYHQARPDDLDHVRKTYEGTGIEVDVRAFFDNMADCLAQAHLMIARAGASTVAELTTAGRPALYIPFPGNRDYQQFYNAEEVARAGGARIVEEKNMTVDVLREELTDLLSHPALLEKMARQSGLLGVSDAAQRLAGIVESVVNH